MPVVRSRLLSFLLLPAILSAVCALASYLAAGPTAGLFFGGIVFASLLTPLLLLRNDEIVGQLLTAASVILGTIALWAVATTLETDLTFKQWALCSLVLVCYLSAVSGMASALRACRLHPVAAAVTVTFLGLLWLTWPIWLSPALAGHERVVSWLTPAHPLLAVDTVSSLGSPWTEHRLMYNQLSILNQNVAYSTPSTTLWTCLFHAFVATITFAVARMVSRHPSSISHHRHPSRQAGHPASA